MTGQTARPRCFLNVAASLDGKIASAARELPSFPSSHDRKMMDRIRARADAVLIGGGTLRAADFPLRVRSETLKRLRRSRGKPEQPINILLSSSLNVPLEGRFFSAPGMERWVITTPRAPSWRRRKAEQRAEVILREGRRVDLAGLLKLLRRRGIHELLLEGGGATNFEFFRKGFVDEIYLTLCPVVIGGARSPTPVDGDGFRAGHFPHYSLVGHRSAGSELFLHYRKA